MNTIYGDLNVPGFWKDSDYANEEYVGDSLTDEMVKSVEDELGYKLPQSYIELMRYQNGGMPKRTNHRTNEPTSWANDHIAISGIFGLDRKKHCSLCGTVGSQFWIAFVDPGVLIADICHFKQIFV